MKEQILLGTLLGDAYIGKLQGRSKTYSIAWEHCLEQEEYALWKAENSLNIDRKAITNNCSGKSKSSGGFIWSKIKKENYYD